MYNCESAGFLQIRSVLPARIHKFFNLHLLDKNFPIFSVAFLQFHDFFISFPRCMSSSDLYKMKEGFIYRDDDDERIGFIATEGILFTVFARSF